MTITATMAREMANRAKPADTSFEIAMNKIMERAKLGYFGASVLVPNEHVDEVISRLSNVGFIVLIDEQRVYHTDLQIDWSTKA